MKKSTNKIVVLSLSLALGVMLVFTMTAFGASPLVGAIGTGDVGGTFYPVGSTFAKIINDKIPNTKMTVQSTGGSVDNARMVGTGELVFGMAVGDIAYQALKGEGPFKKAGPKITSLFATYSSVSQWVVLDSSPIKTFADMKGKKIAVGMPASGSEVVSGAVIKAAGFEYPKDINPRYIGVAEGADGVRDGQIDVACQIGGVPTGGYLDLAQTKDVRFIPMTDKMIAILLKNMPAYSKIPLPANTYRGQTKDIASIGVKALFIANADIVSNEMAYNICKAVWENMDQVRSGHATLKAMTKDFIAKDLAVPLHPGAAKYWKEKGIID